MYYIVIGVQYIFKVQALTDYCGVQVIIEIQIITGLLGSGGAGYCRVTGRDRGCKLLVYC